MLVARGGREAAVEKRWMWLDKMFFLAVGHAVGGDEPIRVEAGRNLVGFDFADELFIQQEHELGGNVGFLVVLYSINVFITFVLSQTGMVRHWWMVRKQVRDWLKKFSGDEGMAPAGEGAVAAELRRLRKENARLLMERDILKKAAAFFAKEQA